MKRQTVTIMGNLAGPVHRSGQHTGSVVLECSDYRVKEGLKFLVEVKLYGPVLATVEANHRKGMALLVNGVLHATRLNQTVNAMTVKSLSKDMSIDYVTNRKDGK